MIGIFDSGAGGLSVLAELRKISDSADILFFRDTQNAPYGTKNGSELKRLVSRDIAILRSHGADAVLMACCTASTVYDILSDSERKISIPIIKPTAHTAVCASKKGKIGVIATERTVFSRAFSREIFALRKDAVPMEWSTQELVRMVEDGITDKTATGGDIKKIKRILSDVIASDIDTLILGCTHFPHISGIISTLLPGVRIISSAEEGARELARQVRLDGCGKTVYISE